MSLLSACAAEAVAASRDASSDAGSFIVKPSAEIAQNEEGAEPAAIRETLLVLENRSRSSIFFRWSGCYDSAAIARPKDPPADSILEERSLAELGCVCDCWSLAREERCTRESCVSAPLCVASSGSTEIEHGGSYTKKFVAAQHEFESKRLCRNPAGYAPNTSFVATFCWSSDPSEKDTCHDVAFTYGESEVRWIVLAPSTDELDAGSN